MIIEANRPDKANLKANWNSAFVSAIIEPIIRRTGRDKTAKASLRCNILIITLSGVLVMKSMITVKLNPTVKPMVVKMPLIRVGMY